jgi:TusA-related sulfurtransferase
MIEVIDTRGLKLPDCIFKIAVNILGVKKGSTLEVLGDCQDFAKNVRVWCVETGRDFLSVQDEGEDKKRIQIQF